MKEPITFRNVYIYEDEIAWIAVDGGRYTEKRGGENERLLLQHAIRQIERERKG